MQIESIKVFCDVARHRSFSQAAAANHVSQSAASQAVSQLERRMGVQLIDRSTRPLQLTRLGRVYYDGCKHLVDQFLELESSVRTAQAQLAASVSVAAIYSVGLGDLGQCITSFEGRHPGCKVTIEYLHPDRVAEKVLDGDADLGLLSFPRQSREVAALPWREEKMVLACPPDHHLAARVAVTPAELDGAKYIGFDKDLLIRRHVDRFLRQHRATVDVTLEFDNIENIKKAIEISAGVALLPEPTLRHEIATGTLVAVPLRLPASARFVRPLGIIHRRQPKLGPTAERFIQTLTHPELDGGASPTASAHTMVNGVAEPTATAETGRKAARPKSAQSTARGRRGTARAL